MKAYSKITAEKIFEMVKSNLPDPKKKIYITRREVQKEFDNFILTYGHYGFEPNAIDNAIYLINNYFLIDISYVSKR
jgi:hypothetical protein